MKLKKNDNVRVIAGNDRGKTGKVLKVFPEQGRVIVEGVNLRKRHTKPSQRNQQGGILEKELPVNVSNVMILDPKTNEPSRIGSQEILGDDNKKRKFVRISKKSGEMLK
ncbi:MAG: 50S ribosomal protein L24 [Ignavibacteriales bacterium]